MGRGAAETPITHSLVLRVADAENDSVAALEMPLREETRAPAKGRAPRKMVLTMRPRLPSRARFCKSRAVSRARGVGAGLSCGDQRPQQKLLMPVFSLAAK
jgi:hypothetical protein